MIYTSPHSCMWNLLSYVPFDIFCYIHTFEVVYYVLDMIYRIMCVCVVQHTATHCNTLQHTATHCNTLQHTASHDISIYIQGRHICMSWVACCDTLQHTATHCNTLQHTATQRGYRYQGAPCLMHMCHDSPCVLSSSSIIYTVLFYHVHTLGIIHIQANHTSCMCVMIHPVCCHHLVSYIPYYSIIYIHWE